MNGVQLLLIAGAGIAVTAIAHRRHWQPGIVVVTLAAAASFLPGVPRLELSSELILALVIPPLLYSATRAVPFSGFRRNLRAIVNLGVVLVLLTTGALGLVTSWLLPTIGLAAAFVLGAVLAPPDTITTVTHGDELGMPRRAGVILAGESLVNDAMALTLFTIAVGAVSGEHTSWGAGLQELVRSAGIGLAIGAGLAAATLAVRKRLGNPTLEVALSLLVPFTAFLAAEQAGASGILAVVIAAFSISVNTSLDPRHQYPGAYRTRLQEQAFWPVLDFLLETFTFAYIGLQLRFVVEDLRQSDDIGLARTLVAAAVLLLTAIVVRLAGVYALFGRWRLHDRHAAQNPRAARHPRFSLGAPTTRETLVVGWTGMRGILTLAVVAGIPETTEGGAPFPGRDAMQFIALAVTLGTLLIQGSTLGPLIRRLHFDTAQERAEASALRRRAEQIAAEAPPGTTDEHFDAQRAALSRAAREGHLDEETARTLIGEIDLRQAARRTLP